MSTMTRYILGVLKSDVDFINKNLFVLSCEIFIKSSSLMDENNDQKKLILKFLQSGVSGTRRKILWKINTELNSSKRMYLPRLKPHSLLY